MARCNIIEMKVGDKIEDFYLVKSKRNKTTRTNKSFLDLDLADGTGSINAKVWDDAERASELFQRGDVIKIRANVEEFQGKRQLKITLIRPVSNADDVDMADLVKTSPHDLAEMIDWIKDTAETIEDANLKALLMAFTDDNEFMEEFKNAAAARNIHHVYTGGLLEHTVKVTKTALFAAEELYPGEVDRDLLIVGSILHDVGKVKELSPPPEVGYTTEGYLLGHIVIGSRLIREKAATLEDFPEDILMQVEHLVVGHHGEKEWGSPAVPMTPEAMIIHQADNLDAKTQIALTAIAECPNDEEDFTDYHRTLGRHFFKRGVAASRSKEEDNK